MSILDDDVDRKSLIGIYENYKNIMIRYAIHMTGNKEMAEDAVHNAFISIIKHKDKLFQLPKKELRTQIVIITKNKSIDLLRKMSFDTDELNENMTLNGLDENPVEEQILKIEEYNTIKRYVESLDESSRLVLEMKYILGMSYKEIGEELGITAKHVDTKIMRAKAKVRKLLATGGKSND